MALAPATVLDAIETRLQTISGLNVRDRMPERLEVPMAVAWLDTPVEFDLAMQRGLDRWPFSILLFVARADSETAQTNLLAYCAASGSSSIKVALEGGTPARTLGGVVHTCRVKEVKDVGVAEVAGVPFLYAEFSFEVEG